MLLFFSANFFIVDKHLKFPVKLLLFLVLFFFILFAAVGCTPGEETDPDLDDPQEDVSEEEITDEELLEEPGQAVRSGRLTLYSDDGTTRWLVASEEAVSHQEGENVTFQPVEAEVFLEEKGEEPDYIMKGEFGRYQIEAGELIFPGSSEIRADRFEFTGEDIIWRQEDNTIFSRGFTEITGDNFTARARGFSAPADLESFTIFGEDDEPARIRWKGEDFSDESFSEE